MTLSELKRRERELRRRLGDERYEQIYTRQQRAEAMSKPAAPAVGNKVENSFYTNRPESGIMSNKTTITDFSKGIENLNKKIDSLNKQQYNTMLSGDGKKTAAYDGIIKDAEKQRDALKMQMARAMGIGSESADKDMLRMGGRSIQPLFDDAEKLKKDIDDIYKKLLAMDFDEKTEFVKTDEAKNYFKNLESLKEQLSPGENMKYRTVLFGDSLPYEVTDDGTLIVKTAPDPTDPSSTFWDSHKRPEDFNPTDPNLKDAPLKPYLKDLYPAEYNDPSTGDSIDLMKGSYQTVAEDAFQRYKGSIGNDVDPYNNMLSVLTGDGLKPGDNLLVEYARKFADKLYYGDEMGGTDLSDHADCSGFVYCLYRDFGITIPRGTSRIAGEVEKGNYVDFVKGPGMSKTGRDSTPFTGDEEDAREAVKVFCDELKPGDLILFDLGDRNTSSYGDVNHVVMYAGNGMIVEEPNRKKYACYHPIEEIIFKKDWRTRLPVYSVSFLTDDERERLTVSGI